MSSERITVTVEFPDRKITIEGPADVVRREVDRLSEQHSATNRGTAEAPDVSRRYQNEREIFLAKAPHGHTETATVLAFFLAENGTKEFSEDDIKKCYLRAGVRPPKVVSQALRDAKNNHDYIARGGKRGLYRLTDHGERVVRFDLPRTAEK